MFNRALGRQFRKPSGLLGHYAAHFMHTHNADYYGRVIDLLEIADHDRILEVGPGAGLAIRMITARNAACRVDGIDFSRLMLRKAGRNNRGEIANARVRLLFGDLCDFDFHGQDYTRVFAINVVYFWSDVGAAFRKLHAILRPRGRCVIFMSSPERLGKVPFAVDGVFNKYTVDYVKAQLVEAGFGAVAHETVVKGGADTYYVTADR